MSNTIFNQIDKDFNSFVDFNDFEKKIVLDYVLSLPQIYDINRIIENYSGFYDDLDLLNKTVDLLVSIINLWNFLLKKDDLNNFKMYYESVDSLSKIFTYEDFSTIFKQDNNFIFSLKKTFFIDNYPNKLKDLTLTKFNSEFSEDKFVKLVDVLIELNDDKFHLVMDINDLNKINKEISQIIKNIENNNNNYEYYL